MKKISKFIFIFFITLGLLTSNIYASSTGYIIDPGWIPGQIRSGNVYSLSSNASTVTGNNCGVYFSELGYLESNYARGDRDFPLWLYEEDFLNADDLVKTYEVYFNYDYASIAYIEVIAVNSPGNIESSGDNVGEFYLSGRMQKLNGDPSSSTNLFYYNIYLN